MNRDRIDVECCQAGAKLGQTGRWLRSPAPGGWIVGKHLHGRGADLLRARRGTFEPGAESKVRTEQSPFRLAGRHDRDAICTWDLTWIKPAAYASIMDPDLLVALKALSDASRLRIVGLLADGRSMSVERLATELELTPGTVVHHLKRLRDAGLVESRARPPYMDYSLRLPRLDEIGGALHRIAREQSGDAVEDDSPAPKWAGPADRRVLRAFFEGDRLVSIPVQRSKRLVVLRALAEIGLRTQAEVPREGGQSAAGGAQPRRRVVAPVPGRRRLHDAQVERLPAPPAT